MAYLGNNLQVAYPSYRTIDDISSQFNGVLKTFALQIGGVAAVPFPINPQQCLISVNGVIQKPDSTGTTGFTLTGTNIVFASAPSAGWAFFGTVLAGADYVNVGANFPSGTAAVPSVTFDQSTGTGLYLVSSNVLGIATSGVQQLTVDSSGNVGITGSVSSAAGTAAAPAYRFTGDTNTGLYSPGADQVGITTGGTVRLTTTTTGITSALPVDVPLGAVGTPSITFTGDLNTGIYSPAADTLAFVEGGVEAMRIDSSGRLGIGTSSPSTKLEISGNEAAANFIVATNTDAFAWSGFRLRNTGTSGRSYDIGLGGSSSGASTAGNFYVYDNTAGAQRITLDSSGRVGIGTSSPSVLTHLATSTDTQLRVESTSASGTNEATVQLIRGSNQSAIKNKAGGLEFFVQGLTNEIARFDSSGRLGIGTTTVGATLDVQAVSARSKLVSTTGTNAAYHTFLNTGGNFYIGLDNSAGADFSAAYAGAIWHGGAYPLVFGTSNAERARIDSSGRLLVGTTSGSGKLTVSGNAIGTTVALTDAATVATDLSLANYYTLTLGGNRTLGAPTNQTAGQSGVIVITQDGTGSRTLAYNSVWKFPNGTVPTLTTTANAVDVLCYYVESGTRITARLLSDVK